MRKISEIEYKKIVVETMAKIDCICRENNLSYMLFYGTLLGAVRHRGFIPWDDDIDIVMKREDYNKLSQIINNGDYGINFISIETNKDTIFPYGKVCDTRTIATENNFVSVEGYGAFVDIFPLDILSPNALSRELTRKVCSFLRKLIVHSARLNYSKSSKFTTNIKRSIAFNVGKLFSTQKLILIYNHFAAKYNNKNSNYIGVADDNKYTIDELIDTVEVEFEGYQFFAPQNYDAILTKIYGNYMELPPIEERISNHCINAYYK